MSDIEYENQVILIAQWASSTRTVLNFDPNDQGHVDLLNGPIRVQYMKLVHNINMPKPFCIMNAIFLKKTLKDIVFEWKLKDIGGVIGKGYIRRETSYYSQLLIPKVIESLIIKYAETPKPKEY